MGRSVVVIRVCLLIILEGMLWSSTSSCLGQSCPTAYKAWDRLKGPGNSQAGTFGLFSMSRSPRNGYCCLNEGIV